MRCEIAHASRGRLRVRYPVSWLRHRRGDVETRLRALPGVHGVSPSTVTGTVRIDYDPFRVAERALLDALDEMHAHLDHPTLPRPRLVRTLRLVDKPTPLLNLLGATGVLATVQDNGCGFALKGWHKRCLEGDHLGLLGLEERVTLLGGSFCVESEPGKGTTVYADIPLKEAM